MNYLNYARLIVQKMSNTITKSWRLFHKIIICNIEPLSCTKLEKMGFARELPGHAQILEGSISWEPDFSRTWKFWDDSTHYFLPFLKFSSENIYGIFYLFCMFSIANNVTLIVPWYLSFSGSSSFHFLNICGSTGPGNVIFLDQRTGWSRILVRMQVLLKQRDVMICQ